MSDFLQAAGVKVAIPGERWSFAYEGKLRPPKGPPPDGTFTINAGGIAIPGTLIRMRATHYDRAVYHARIWGKRVRVVATERGSFMHVGGIEIDYFPRHRSRRMAGK